MKEAIKLIALLPAIALTRIALSCSSSGWCARNEIDYTNERGYYRTCTIYKDNPALVNGMTFSKDSKVDWYPISRTTGFSVRAVHE